MRITEEPMSPFPINLYAPTRWATGRGMTHLSEASYGTSPRFDLAPICGVLADQVASDPERGVRPIRSAFDRYLSITTTADGRVASFRCEDCWDTGLRFKHPQLGRDTP